MKVVMIDIMCGVIKIEFYDEQVFKIVVNFVKFSEEGFYDGLIFYCVIVDFMVQVGCFNGIGMGGFGYIFEDEFVGELCYDVLGVFFMVNVGFNMNGSQFFIIYVLMFWFDGKYSVFGCVFFGQDIVDLIVQGDVMNKVMIFDEQV